MKKGTRMSLESRIKMRLSRQRYFMNGGIGSNKGRRFSVEVREKMSRAQKKRVFEEYKGKITKICLICGITMRVFPHLESRKKLCSKKCFGKWIGQRQLGEKSHFWKGGVTSENKKWRTRAIWKRWRETVFKRDNWTCQECGIRGGIELHPDHIKPFSLYPELRFELNNGRTLCINCHHKTPTWGGNIRWLKEELSKS